MYRETQNTQPKVSLSKVLLMFCLSAAIVMGTMPCEPFLMRANADPAEKTITCLGAQILSLNCAETSAATVYYGSHNGENLTWRVINYDGDGALSNGGNNNLTMLSGGILGLSPFRGDNSNNYYSGSDLKTAIDNIYNTGYFTEKEKSAIQKRELLSGEFTTYEETDCISGNALMGNDAPYLWPLSGKEAAYIYNIVKDKDDNYLSDPKGRNRWWLRSPSRDYDSFDSYECLSALDVSIVGTAELDHDQGFVQKDAGVRPAFNLGLSSVVSTSLVSEGTKYKVTLLDRDMSVSPGKCLICNDNKIIVPYTIADNSSSDPTQLSVIVTKGYDNDYITVWTDNGWRGGNLDYISFLQYSKLDVKDFSLSGTGTFTLDPSIPGNWGQDYHVYILAEDVNGEHETDYASAPVEIKQAPAAAEVKAFAEEQEFTYDGKPHGITVNVTYPESGVTVRYGESPDNCTLTTCPTITNVSDSPKTIYYKAEADGYVSASGSATVKINKADSVIKKASAARLGLKYSGGAMALVNAGTVTGGDMYYAVTTENAAPAGSSYTKSIPEKTDAGTYYVWYKVIGDGNHKNTEAECVKVTISEKEEPKEPEKKIVEKTVSSNTLNIAGKEITVDTVVSSEEDESGKGYSVGQVEIPDEVALALFNNLSEEEKEQVKNGEKFSITISVNEAKIDMENEEVKKNKENADKKIKEVTGGTVEAKGIMLDMGLFVQVGNGEKKETEPADGSGKIAFTVKVPVEMKNSDDSIVRTFYLVHIHDDGKVEIVSSGTGTEIPAETDSFSYWYLTYVDEKKVGDKKEDDKKEDDSESTVTPPAEKVITAADNLPMTYSEEAKGDFKISYCHEIPFFGKAKPDLTFFGDIKVTYGGKEYKAAKIKVNKKKCLIQITGLEGADKDTVKAVKKATKGSNGLSFKVNPYYVKTGDKVTPKFKKDGSIKSLKVEIKGKDYKVKKGEFSYDAAEKTVTFTGSLSGSYKFN